MELIDFPGRIPGDAYLNDLAISDQKDWTLYDDYYRNEVITPLRKESYFRNLQWATISTVVKNTDFLDEATLSDHLFYLNEIGQRDYINEPDVAVLLLEKLFERGVAEAKIAAYARTVIEKNKDYLSEENFARHSLKNKEAFGKLHELGYSRWGEEK